MVWLVASSLALPTSFVTLCSKYIYYHMLACRCLCLESRKINLVLGGWGGCKRGRGGEGGGGGGVKAKACIEY